MGNHYGDNRLQKLNALHKVVARELAFGMKIADICQARGLVYGTWNQIVNCELFKQEVERIQREIENQEIDEFCNDPVRMRLRNARMVAAERVIEEIDNHDKEFSGATAQTRLAASRLVLEANDDLRSTQNNGTNVIIQLSENVLNRVLEEKKPMINVTPKNFTLETAPVNV